MSSPRRRSFDGSMDAALSFVPRVPMSDMPVARGGGRRSSHGSFGGASGSATEFVVLPPITTRPQADAQRHLVEKIRQCCVCFNFGRPDEAKEAKEAKRETLLEIVHYVVAHPNCLTPEVYQEIRIMVEANVWRPLGPKLNVVGQEYDPDDVESVDDLAWPHLHVCYELLLQVLESPNFDRKLAKRAFPESFALRLLQMLDSEDARERDFLKVAMHRLYRRFLHLRTAMREQMQYQLQEYVETQNLSMYGVYEMLEILGSIVEGFAVPLKDHHVEYLHRVILPLAKMPTFIQYHGPWMHCVLQYLLKDPSQSPRILRYLFRHWPVQSARKQVVLLNCIETMVGSLADSDLGTVSWLLFDNIAKILSSPHFQVADRCLAMLQNPRLREHVRRNSAAVIRVLYPLLTSVARDHWNGQLQKTALEQQNWLKKLNPTVCREFSVPGTASVALSKDPNAATWQKIFEFERQPEKIPTKRSSTSQLRLQDRGRTEESRMLMAKYGIGPSSTKALSSKENTPN